jgi:hypothetical protein
LNLLEELHALREAEINCGEYPHDTNMALHAQLAAEAEEDEEEERAETSNIKMDSDWEAYRRARIERRVVLCA